MSNAIEPRSGGRNTAVGGANAEGVNVTHGKAIKYTLNRAVAGIQNRVAVAGTQMLC
ncbi:MAG: hypothetical protein IKP58_02265 [Victivallales bacterium]|nr:hypothetical protein [Victivallales bacterium]